MIAEAGWWKMTHLEGNHTRRLIVTLRKARALEPLRKSLFIESSECFCVVKCHFWCSRRQICLSGSVITALTGVDWPLTVTPLVLMICIPRLTQLNYCLWVSPGLIGDRATQNLSVFMFQYNHILMIGLLLTSCSKDTVFCFFFLPLLNHLRGFNLLYLYIQYTFFYQIIFYQTLLCHWHVDREYGVNAFMAFTNTKNVRIRVK